MAQAPPNLWITLAQPTAGWSETGKKDFALGVQQVNNMPEQNINAFYTNNRVYNLYNIIEYPGHILKWLDMKKK